MLVFALLVTLIACNNNKNPEETTGAATTNNEETTTVAEATKGETTGEETTNTEETTAAEETTVAEETTEEEVTTENPKPADGIYATDDAEAQWKHTSFDECEARDTADAELKKAFTPGHKEELPDVFDVPCNVASIRFWGWLATSAKVVAVGYQIDGGDVAFNDAFLVEAEQGVIDAAAGAGASNATRYRTYADVSGVSAGEHTVACIYKLEDGTLVRYIEIKINKAVDPNAPVDIITVDRMEEIFNTGKEAAASNHYIQMMELVKKDGYATLTSTDGDPYLALVPLDSNYDAAQYLLIVYRTTSDQQGQIFVGSAGGWTGANDQFTFSYEGDGKWHAIVVDLKLSQNVTSDTLTYLRWDFFAGNGGSIDVAYAAFFTSEDAGKAYAEKNMPADAIDPADIFDLDLSDGCKDASAAKNDVEVVGTPKIVDRNGDKTLDFDGTGSSYLKVPGFKNFYDTIAKGFTFELDFEMKDMGGEQYLASNAQAGGLGFGVDDGKMSFLLNLGNGGYETVGFVPQVNTRYHVVVTYSGDALTMYVNGEKVASKQVSGTFQPASQDGSQFLCIGGDSNQGNVGELFANAYIYGVRIYSAVATEEQAKILYNN